MRVASKDVGKVHPHSKQAQTINRLLYTWRRPLVLELKSWRESKNEGATPDKEGLHA